MDIFPETLKNSSSVAGSIMGNILGYFLKKDKIMGTLRDLIYSDNVIINHNYFLLFIVIKYLKI